MEASSWSAQGWSLKALANGTGDAGPGLHSLVIKWLVSLALANALSS